MTEPLSGNGSGSAPEPRSADGPRGARARTSRPEPRERLRFGGPLGPDWVRVPQSESAADAGADPGSGPGPGPEPATPHGGECLEWCPVCRTAEVVRASLPPELRTQLEGVQRDALVAVRAMLDHYIDRLDTGGRESSRVEDIPIS